MKKKRALRDAGTISEADLRKLEALYRKGPAAYGSVANLKKASGLSWRKVNNFLQGKNAHTKYRQFPRRFPRLKVIAFDINEIWSIDVAYVDKLAKYNHGVKYLLVAVDVLSRKLRVQPMRSKSASETVKSFSRMIIDKKPKKFGQIKELSLKELSKNFVKRTASRLTQLTVKQNLRLRSEIFVL